MLAHFRNSLWLAVVLVGVVLLVVRFGGQGQTAPEEQSPAFFADFALTDPQETTRRDEQFTGEWLLVFFGFTSCPDVCPTTLAEVDLVLQELGSSADQVQPIFISIDPERDDPKAVGEFVSRFDSRILGLTGTPDQIAATADSFNIFYERVEDEAAPNGYTMSHSSQLFLFDPEGGFARSYAYGTPAEEIADDLVPRLQ